MKNILEKFFTLKWIAPKIPRSPEVFKTSPFDMPVEAYFRDDQSYRPRVALGVKRPDYELPRQTDFAGWCANRISEKMSQFKSFQNEKYDNTNGSTVIQFHKFNGIRSFDGNSASDKSTGENNVAVPYSGISGDR